VSFYRLDQELCDKTKLDAQQQVQNAFSRDSAEFWDKPVSKKCDLYIRKPNEIEIKTFVIL